jgi:hypothetical protein
LQFGQVHDRLSRLYLLQIGDGVFKLFLPDFIPTGEEGEQTGAGIRYGSDKRNNYIW